MNDNFPTNDLSPKRIAELIIEKNGLQLYKTDMNTTGYYVYNKHKCIFDTIQKVSLYDGMVVSGINQVIKQLALALSNEDDSEKKGVIISSINKLKNASYLRSCKEWFRGTLESTVLYMPLQNNADMSFGGFMYRLTHDTKYPIEQLCETSKYGKIVTSGCIVKYDRSKTGTGKVWNEKLIDLLPDENDRKYFQAMMGSALTGHEKRMLIMHTQKNCGKSTIARTINRILCDYAGSGGANMFCKSSQNDNSASSLSGVDALLKQRMTIIDEVDHDFKWNINFIKQVTGGAPVTHKKMFQDQQSTIVHTTPIVWTNHMPVDYSFDDAVKSRIHFLPRFNQVDTSKVYIGLNGREIRSADDLEEYLIEYESEAILAWFIEGWQIYIRNEYTVPEQCIITKAEIEADIRDNVVTAWMSEHGFGFSDTEQSIRNGCSLMSVTNFISSFGRSFGYRSTNPSTVKNMLSENGAFVRLSCKNKYVTNLIFTTESGTVINITKDNIKRLKSLYATVKIDAITTEMIETYLLGNVIQTSEAM
jgi:energy-coupling factor transporter ATP-binding protein EcfA2